MNRFAAILPGFLTWATILGLLSLSFINPELVTVLILLYAVYWLIRIAIMTSYLIAGYLRYRSEVKIDWLAKLHQDFPEQWRQLYHLIIIPTYKEDISILRHTLESVAASKYENQNILMVLAFEARDKELGPKYAPILTKEFEHRFGGFLTTFHPSDLDGEVKGKGPNITWAARQARNLLKSRQINPEQVIVTTLDADNRTDPQYLANVSWAYLNDPDPVHKSFQPLPMYFNNIWQVPLPVKITALGSSFWQMIQAMRPHYARNFSAHAQSFAALIKTDYWSVTTVVEDGHQYWRSYFVFNGQYSVVPIFVPVYMDSVQGETIAETFKEQYLQRRRWYWGVSDIPFVFEHCRKNKKIPFFSKWLQFARLLESHYSLATQSFILLIGWLPLALNPDFGSTVLGYNFPTVYRTFLIAAWVGMIANMTVASTLVPPRPGRAWRYWLAIIKEWVLAPFMMPISGILFSALPAIDSQTRLMLNKPFTVFNVTKKLAVPSGVVRIES